MRVVTSSFLKILGHIFQRDQLQNIGLKTKSEGNKNEGRLSTDSGFELGKESVRIRERTINFVFTVDAKMNNTIITLQSVDSIPEPIGCLLFITLHLSSIC